MSFIEWSQLLHGIKLVAHVLQGWQSSVIFKTASPNVRKINPLFCFSRQGSDRRWIESLGDKPDRHYYFLWRQHHLQIKTIAGIHVKEMQQGVSHIGNHA